MVSVTQCTFVALFVFVLVVMVHVNSCEGASKKKCRFKAKRTQCVDIIPKRQIRKYKHCPQFDMSSLGRCTIAGGYCKILPTRKGNRCVCEEEGRYFRDQPWNPSLGF